MLQSTIKETQNIVELLTNILNSQGIEVRTKDWFDINKNFDPITTKEVDGLYVKWEEIMKLRISETDEKVEIKLIDDIDTINTNPEESIYIKRVFNRPRRYKGLGTRIIYIITLYCLFKNKRFLAYPSGQLDSRIYWKKLSLPHSNEYDSIEFPQNYLKKEELTKIILEKLGEK